MRDATTFAGPVHPGARAMIIGAGVSGLACGLALTRAGVDVSIYERDSRPGGLARTDDFGGFRFDRGPHVLLGVTPELMTALESYGLSLRRCQCSSSIYYESFARRYIPASVQENIAKLPWRDRLQCASDYLRSRRKPCPTPTSHREALDSTLGRRLVDLFFEPYANKRLSCRLDEIHPEWTTRVKRPSMRDVVWNGLVTGRGAPGFDSTFLYPSSGGIEELPRALVRQLPPRALKTNAELIELDLHRRTASFSNGQTEHFDWLVCSVPLDELLQRIRDVPAAVVGAGRELCYGSTYVVNLGYDVPLGGPRGVVRFPEPSLGFYRLSFPTSYAVAAAPPGCDAVVVEVGHHPVRNPMSAEAALARVRVDLGRIGVVPRGALPVVEHFTNIRVSHVIHGPRTPAALELIRSWLEENGVFVCGKYGEWRELLMPGAMRSGQVAAEKILERIALRGESRALAVGGVH